MRVVALGLALAVLAARPADAGTILYATAASSSRVLGFCVAPNGSLAPQPAISIDVATRQLRRLLVRKSPDGVHQTLYVAGIDRVEAYQIGPGGGLTQIGRTNIDETMTPRDIQLSPDGNLLYVPQRGVARIAGYRLDSATGAFLDGAGPAPFVTCVQGPLGIGYHSLFVDPTVRPEMTPCTTTTTTLGPQATTSTTLTTTPTTTTSTLTTTRPPYSLVYASSVGLGRVDVFPIDEEGMFLDCRTLQRILPAECIAGGPNVTRSEATTSFSFRNRLARPKTVLVDDGILYVNQRARRRLTAFQLLPDGNFKTPTPTGKKGRNLKPQPFWSRTKQVLGYEDVVFDGSHSTLIGSGFVRGRIDSFRLDDIGKLRHQPTRTSKQDLRMTPVRIAVGICDPPTTNCRLSRVLFVAGGQRNRVLAYRLREDGVLADTEPFSTTEDQEDSFLNDVALATIPGCN